MKLTSVPLFHHNDNPHSTLKQRKKLLIQSLKVLIERKGLGMSSKENNLCREWIKKISWKKKVIRVLYLGIFLHFFLIYQDLLIFFDLVLFWAEWLIFGISGSPIGISLIRLSELLDCTEVNPSKYVEPNSFEHKPCSWAPYKHLQLFATKSLFLLLLLLLWTFLAFSSCRREVLWIGHWVWYSLRRIKLGPRLRNGLSRWCIILFEIWRFCGWTSS